MQHDKMEDLFQYILKVHLIKTLSKLNFPPHLPTN